MQHPTARAHALHTLHGTIYHVRRLSQFNTVEQQRVVTRKRNGTDGLLHTPYAESAKGDKLLANANRRSNKRDLERVWTKFV